jgi:hypothetical protein
MILASAGVLGASPVQSFLFCYGTVHPWAVIVPPQT